MGFDTIEINLVVVVVVVVAIVVFVVVVLNVDVVAQLFNHVKPNSVELSWGCVEVKLGLWQFFIFLDWISVP